MTQPLRLLHTAECYPPLVSGVPEVVSQISERLARRGHEVHVATSAVPGAPAYDLLRGVHVHRFAVSGNQKRGIRGDISSYLALLHHGPWDAIAAHCAQVWPTDVLLEEPVSAPLVFVAHGLSAYRNPQWGRYFERLAAWLRAGTTMVSIASTGLEDAAFRRDHSLPPAVTIANGIDAALWSAPPLPVRRAWGFQHGAWLVNVSTHDPAKGHTSLFRLMCSLGRLVPHARLTQIGHSHPARRWDLGRLGVTGGCSYSCRARALKMPSIDLRFNIPREQTISAVQQADLTVLTSTWEASPLVILESMAAGTPFVSFDVGCVREHVGGVVVDSAAALTEAVRELLADPCRRAELGRQGRRRIVERHNWEAIVDQYEALYRRLSRAAPAAEVNA